jgi:peptidoglycan lytic transglycosylase D
MKRIFPIWITLIFSVCANAQIELVAKRLNQLQMNVPLSYNTQVGDAIDHLLLNDQSKTAIIIGKSAVYLKQIEDTFTSYGLPTELRFLAPALSEYSNWKVSEDGGSGIWQMRYLTAKRFGLNISSYVDERRDVSKSTSAAAQYFTELHKIYGDWLLTIAAFCSDEVEINKAIRMAGGKKDYWELQEFLPTRFQQIVPNFIASVYVHSYYQMHNLEPIELKPINTEAVLIERWTTIYQISKALEMNFDTLKDLNAIYKKQVIPHTNKVYHLNIPFEKVGLFYSLGDSIYTFSIISEEEELNQPHQNTVQVAEMQEPQGRSKSNSSKSSTKTLYYTVKKGDFLGRIADLYDVNISDLRRWNGVRGDRLSINQRIKILVSSSMYSKYSKINSLSAYQKQQLINKD